MSLSIRLTILLLLCTGLDAQQPALRPLPRLMSQLSLPRDRGEVQPAEPVKPPNIIFILCDDLGYGDVGVFHQLARAERKDPQIPSFKTPNIDAMANKGIKLTQHYCAAPVCAPSRASLLTGLTQGHAPIRNNQFDKELPDQMTIASVLREAGYSTAAIGKWGLQGKPTNEDQPNAKGVEFPGWPAMPIARGFDYFLGYVRHKDGHFHYPFEDQRQIWENHSEISGDMKLCFTTDLFTAAAKKWIAETKIRNPEEPFFLFLAYDTPHAKLQNPPCAYPKGGGLDGGVQWIGGKDGFLNTANGTYDGWIHPDVAKATWDHDKNPETAEVPWPEAQQRYVNNVRRIDDAVGDLLDVLKDLGIDEDTLVVFSSDNGPSEESYIKEHPYRPTFFEGYGPFEGIKRDTLEGGMRVPTIACWPSRIEKGGVDAQPSGQWDWLATFADAAGLATPAASDGKSLLYNISRNPGVPTRLDNRVEINGRRIAEIQIGRSLRPASRILYTEYAVDGKTPQYPEFDPSHQGKPRGQMQVVFINNYKGIRTDIRDANQNFEIYDIKEDPKELNNLAKDGGLPDIQQQMKAKALQCRLPLEDAKRPYDDAPIPGIDQQLNRTYPGVSLRGYQGKWPWMPDFGALRSSQFGGTFNGFEYALDYVQRAATEQERSKPPFGIQIKTHVVVPADGHYTFTTKGDGQTMLFVHNIRLIQELPHEGEHTQSGTLHLKAGSHPITYLYRTTRQTPDFGFELRGPDDKLIPLTEENLRVGLQFMR